jgi:hypothetical protein
MALYNQPTKVATPDISYPTDPNTVSAKDTTHGMPARRVSVSDPGANNVKTSGVAQRGKGAATKGFTSRGPMA